VLRLLSEEERREFREWMGRSVRALVRDAARVDDPTELELLAARLVPPALHEGGSPGALAELVALVAETKGGRSLLRPLSVAALPPVSTLATEALARLGDGPLTVAAQRAGTLVPERAFALDADEPVTSVLVACRRPGGADRQVLGFTFEWPATGGAIKDAFAGTMLPGPELEQALLEPARAQGIDVEEVPVADAVERVAQGARRCAEVGFGPDREALPAVTLLLRAAGHPDADELAVPLAGLPALADVLDGVLDEELEEPERDEEELRAELDELAAALDDWCAGEGFDEEWRDLVCYAGGTMADFRAWYADGEPTAWSAVDIGEYLLDFVPRKVGIDDDHVERFPQAVAEVLRFLGATGRLEPEAAELLARTAIAASEEFVARATDPRNFGLAKAMTTAMLAAGVDPSDQRAVDGWIAAYNALPEEERHRRVPAFARPNFVAPAPPRPQAKPAAGKRKARAKAHKTQRQARRRNRRS
jgi:hypothetical protein